MLLAETRLVERRIAKSLAHDALMTRAAVASLLSKDASKDFQKRIKQMTES